MPSSSMKNLEGQLLLHAVVEVTYRLKLACRTHDTQNRCNRSKEDLAGGEHTMNFRQLTIYLVHTLHTCLIQL